MHNLILLTNGYPYGTWETYLETEVQHYMNIFISAHYRLEKSTGQ